VKFRFVACPAHVINGNYSNCRLGDIKYLQGVPGARRIRRP
jgi:hypothetical protein